MKSLIKILLYRVIGKLVYCLMKLFYVPPPELRRKLRFKGRFRVRTQDGKSFSLYNNAFHLENHIFWLGLEQYPWEKMSRRIWTSLCAESEVVFDIGANTGIYSLLAKVYNPAASVFAFEPQPNVYRVLVKNRDINRFDIRTEQLALSDRGGILPFYNYGPDTFTTENTTAGSLNREWVTREQSSIKVKVSTLVQYLGGHGNPKIDLMKIDVETLEFEVLMGYGSHLGEHLPIILLEIQSAGTGHKIASLLPEGKYQLFSIIEPYGLRPVDRLGENREHLNYLMCPVPKEYLLNEFIISD